MDDLQSKYSIRWALRNHRKEYLAEAVSLAIFMVSACFFAAVLEHPASILNQAIPSPFFRRMLMGLAMGLTAIGIIYSPLGQCSGAHMNPAVSLTFFRLRKIMRWDLLFYILSQFGGGVLGVGLAGILIGPAISHPAVNYVATVPGASGVKIAFLTEFLMSFGLMITVLTVSSHPKYSKYTGVFCGVLLASYITFWATLSGMSINPARTVGSALFAHEWRGWWVYLTAPALGMLTAAEVYLFAHPIVRSAGCAKLFHPAGRPCIFCWFRQHNGQKA